MVLTRNQKRLFEEIPQDHEIRITKKKRFEQCELESEGELECEGESEGELSDTITETDDESECNLTPREKLDRKSKNDAFKKIKDELNLDSTNIQDIINKVATDVLKSFGLKEESKDEENDNLTRFNNYKDLVYSGDFFQKRENDSCESELSDEQLQIINKEFEDIRSKQSIPDILDVVNLDIPLETKRVLLEKICLLENVEPPSLSWVEYNSLVKSINSEIQECLCPQNIHLKLLENDLKSRLNVNDSLKTKILNSEMSFNNKLIAYKKYASIENILNSEDSIKQKTWLDALLTVPFNKFKGIDLDECNSKNIISNVRNVLDSKLSFLEKPKDQIINIVSQLIKNPHSNVNSIGLFGERGLGKSEISKSIADALGRPFKMICLGGSNDSSTLNGHDYTYVGSQPGKIVELLIESQCMNPVILLDELDKISDTERGKEIIGTLIHLTDSTINNNYSNDKYFSGIEFDLSKVLFIFTYNDASKLDPILADRIYKININNYTIKEKIEIVKKHIIPDVLKRFNYTSLHFDFNEDVIQHIVNLNPSDIGMRNIKAKIHTIVSRLNTLLLSNESDVKLNYKKLYSKYNSLPISLQKDDVNILLEDSPNKQIESTVPFGMYI